MKRFVLALCCASAVVMGGPAMALGVAPSPDVPALGPNVSTADAQALLQGLGLGLPPVPANPPSLISTPAPGGAVQPSPSQARSFALPPAGGDPFPKVGPKGYAGYGTGTAFSSDSELSGVGVSVEKAFSSAVYGSEALPPRSDEVDRPATPALEAGHGFGAASAADIGTGEDRLDLPDDISASAPPNGDEKKGEVADVALLPVLHADLLRTRAAARTAGAGCVIGSDLASGRATALRSDVPGEKKDAERPLFTISGDDPARAVTESRSRVGLLPPATKDTARFGIFSETRQTIAPVTFLKGTPNEVTVEVAGEWVLRVASDGRTATFSYGPDVEDKGTPVLRIDRPGKKNDVVLTAQDIFDSRGEDISTPGVEEFIIGEPPRVIGGATGSSPLAQPTRVSAAVDVLRLLIPDDREADGLAEVVVGHMEAAVALPAGGISCPGIAMAKEASSAEVEPGEEFTWTVTVANPNNCLLERVSLVDSVKNSGALRYEITGTNPNPTDRDGDTLTFTGFRPLQMGESFKVTVRAKMAKDSPPGRFTNDVASAGACGPAPSRGEASGDGGGAGGDGGASGTEKAAPVILSGNVTLTAPAVTEPNRLPLVFARTPASSASPGAVGSGPTLLAQPARLSGATRRPSGAARQSSGSTGQAGGLARTGGWIAFGPGLGLLAGGVIVRRSAGRRC
jgi:hypothetical protein